VLDYHIRIEVEDGQRHLLIALGRSCEYIGVHWQDAFALAETLDLAITDITDPLDVISVGELDREASQVKLNHRGEMVFVFFAWTDRLRFSWRPASLFRDALKKVAQDAQLAGKGVHLVYNQYGMIRRLFNRKTGCTQHIPGR
jgi:hypothetical protein